MNKINKKTNLGVLVLLVWLGAVTASYGQFSEGAKAVGGGIGFSSRNTDYKVGTDTKFRNFYFTTNAGYFVMENLEAGMSLSAGTEKYEQELASGDVETKANEFKIGPYARLYNPLTEVISVFAELGINFGFGGDGEDQRIRTFDSGISPGILLLLDKNLAMEARLGYLGYSRRAEGDKDNFEDTRITSGGFDAGFDLSRIRFGFRLYIN